MLNNVMGYFTGKMLEAVQEIGRLCKVENRLTMKETTA